MQLIHLILTDLLLLLCEDVKTTVIKEYNMVNIKNKMTDIKRNRNDVIFQNYYNNCDDCEEIFAIYGNDSIVFWYNDNGIDRGYFYSSDREELGSLLEKLPTGCIVDYLTKKKDDFLGFLENSKLALLHESIRMSEAGLTEEDKRENARKREILKRTLYKPQNVRCSHLEDLDLIYNKLYDVFDPREAHLPAKDEFASYISNGWVSIYFENNLLQAIYVFKVVTGARYGYLLWNEAGPEGYFSVIAFGDELYERYIKDNAIKVSKSRPDYSWVNSRNKKAIRVIEFWGQKFDGLHDFIYEKI